MTPRTKEQNEEIRLRRLAQIRRAAADVFLDKGMTLDIRDVAAAAGLGYGTVYHYYSNKGDLLYDVLWTAMDRAGEWLVAGNKGDPLVAAGVRLLEMWAEDHGVYLLYKLAAEEFRLLPEARAAPLAEAFRREVLLPFAAGLSSSPPLSGDPPASAEHSGQSSGDLASYVRQAEWLLAALAGCAGFPLRRGTLDREAAGIARLLLHQLSERTASDELLKG
ncbi:TetR/AcrR family transcriptional regulator [Paenibacillus phocaensis]|uniref:TetR/AcrR family transcriptional regulator n=1 Tax=Paenibacillus phocaensis TaxID=1776378 RepID=UPI000839D419|nr:TetR/AcrR family transcriptional regulator [Paenibacillus phocaensis]